MNYQSIYNRLIETRKSRILIKDVYYEKHHILPKSMGGENSIDNLVHLTAREHFLAHWLLWRIHKTPCMSHSFFYMCSSLKSKHLFTPSSRSYEEAKLAISFTGFSEESKKKMSNVRKGKSLSEFTRKKLSIANFGKKLSEETRTLMSKSKLGIAKTDDTKQKMSAAQKISNNRWKNHKNEHFKVLICKQCLIEFQIYKSQSRQFCSQKCYHLNRTIVKSTIK